MSMLRLRVVLAPIALWSLGCSESPAANENPDAGSLPDMTDGSDDDSGDGDGDGAMPLPNPMTEDVVGDFYIPSGETVTILARTDSWPTIDGSLRVEPGATLDVERSLRIRGPLVLEPSSTVKHDGSQPFDFGFVDTERLEAVGTSEATIALTGTGTLEITTDDIDMAWVVARPRIWLQVGPNPNLNESVESVDQGRGSIRDSVFGDRGSYPSLVTFAGSAPEEMSVMSHNRFERTRLVMGNVSFRNNDLIEAFVDFGNPSACVGDRSRDLALDFADNVIDTSWVDPPHSEIFSVGRAIGPLAVGSNFYSHGLSDSFIEDWDGSPGGCGDDLGAHGGPLTVPAHLVEPPSVGPQP